MLRAFTRGLLKRGSSSKRNQVAPLGALLTRESSAATGGSSSSSSSSGGGGRFSWSQGGGALQQLQQVRRLADAAGSGAHHKGSVYIHHSDVGAAINSVGLTIGLVHALQALVPGVGYFRPIDHTSHGGNRAELIRDIFKMDTPLEDMIGCTQQKAYELIARNEVDDLLELIFPAFERCKERHDYLVIEGTSLRDGSNTTPINGLIASTLESPALLVNDAEAAAQMHPDHERNESFEDWDWEREAVQSVVDHARIMRQYNVESLGALFYRVPVVERGDRGLREQLKKEGIPFLGAIPADDSLQALTVEDAKHALHAEIMYGTESSMHDAMSTEISKSLVATLHLADFLTHIPDTDSPEKGALVIAHASRPDLLLGMINLHETHLPTHVAAMVLTGGSQPPVEIDNLIESRGTPNTLPVLLSPMDTNDTCITLAECTPQITADSKRKIELAQVLFQNNVNMKELSQALLSEHETDAGRMNPRLFEHNIFVKAREANKHIVLPEGEEPRTVQAAGEVLRRGLCRLTLLGNPDKINALAKQLRVDLSDADIVDPKSADRLEEYVQLLHQRRKSKGVTPELARDLLTADVNYFGTAMVEMGHANGMVSGAIHTTANTVRPPLQLIKTFPETPLVSSAFFMCLPDKVLVYADCAVNEDPNPDQLATIAISSADTAKAFGLEPRVAMLSYATGDSNSGPIIQKVADATAIAQKKRPDLAIEGPLQYDAAVNPETARTKMKGKETKVAGKANVLIFPDLNTGNNTYKAVQQSTGAIAMGPVLQGLRKPVNDLSRGCTVKDIVTTIAITAVQAAGMDV